MMNSTSNTANSSTTQTTTTTTTSNISSITTRSAKALVKSLDNDVNNNAVILDSSSFNKESATPIEVEKQCFSLHNNEDQAAKSALTIANNVPDVGGGASSSMCASSSTSSSSTASLS